jgi:hypothetical protein
LCFKCNNGDVSDVRWYMYTGAVWYTAGVRELYIYFPPYLRTMKAGGGALKIGLVEYNVGSARVSTRLSTTEGPLYSPRAIYGNRVK